MKDDPSMERGPIKPAYTPIVKWYNTTWTYEQKYKCGLLTYEEYLMWMEELKNEEEEKKGPKHGTTFWQNDEGERENLSSSDYNDFLAQNGISVANSSTVDVASLLAETENAASGASSDAALVSAAPPQSNSDHNALISEEVNVDDILKSVNASIKGDDFLTQEEIEALFAAANAGEKIG